MDTLFFNKQCFFSAEARLFLRKKQNFSVKSTLPYLTKRRLKCYLDQVQSFLHNSFGSVLNNFRDQCFKIGHFQPSVVKVLLIKRKACSLLFKRCLKEENLSLYTNLKFCETIAVYTLDSSKFQKKSAMAYFSLT